MRTAISVLLVTLLVPVLIGQILLQSVQLAVRPENLTGLITESGFTAKMGEMLVARLSAEGEVESQEAQIFARAMQNAMSSPEASQVTGELAVAFQAALFGGSQPPAPVGLGGLRATLLASFRTELETEMATWTPCSAAQMRELAAGNFDDVPPCRITDPTVHRQFVDAIMAQMELELSETLPDQIDLAADMGSMSEVRASLEEDMPLIGLLLPESRSGAGEGSGPVAGSDGAAPGATGGFSGGFSRFGWLVAAGLLLLLMLVNLSPWPTAFRKAATPLILAGGFTLALGYGLGRLLGSLGAVMDLSSPEAGMILAVVEPLIQDLAGRIQGLALWVLAGGLGCLAIWLLGRMLTRPSTPSASRAAS